MELLRLLYSSKGVYIYIYIDTHKGCIEKGLHIAIKMDDGQSRLVLSILLMIYTCGNTNGSKSNDLRTSTPRIKWSQNEQLVPLLKLVYFMTT